MSPASLLALAACAQPAPAEPVTYSKHVAPIVYRQCASCHRPGEVAPFSLLTYKDAARRADQLAEATGSRAMPPWKAEPGYGDFRDARTLTPAERKVFADWAKAGAPEGDPRDRPPAPTFSDGWPLGPPDLVVKMTEAVAVPAEGRDQIRVVPLDLKLTSDKVLSAVDFRPGNRSVVHHALVVVDNFGLMRDGGGRKQAAGRLDPTGLVDLFRPRSGPPFALIGAWVPGSTPQFMTDGYGIPLAKDARVVLQMHYHPVGKAATDQSEVALYFAKKAGATPVHSLSMAGFPLVIPAGEKDHRVTTSFTLPVAVTLHGVGPHMHQLGREMKADATLPDGTKTPLIWVRDWDWDWQGRYLYKEPVRLPAGARIDLEAVYDNSADNPANPSTPPRVVRWGEQTTDEMCLLFLMVSAGSPEDVATLRREMIRQRFRPAEPAR